MNAIEVPFPHARLLDDLAKKPCACGKRRCGDRQVFVGPLNRASGDMGIRLSAHLRCQVCGDVHKAAMIVTVLKEIV